MHLLPRDIHSLDEASAATDLGQTPADIVFLSFSDSELQLLTRQHAGDNYPSLRCAQLAKLKHPYSVDLYLDSVASCAKLIVVRLLGGKDYWSYGVEQLESLARRHGIMLAIVPGDVVDDQRLSRASTLDAETLSRIWRYFQDGGPDNLQNFLRFAATLTGRTMAWSESAPVANAGRFIAGSRANQTSIFRASLIFYRSLYLADDIAPIISLAETLSERGFAVDTLYVASIKDPESENFLAQALDEFAPDVVINSTAFSAKRATGSVLDRADAPVLQVALTTCTQEAWAASPRGANGADLAMNIVLPEVDGRIFTRAISFKEPDLLRGSTEFNSTRHAPEQSRIAFVADLAASWAALRRKKNYEKRLALVLSDYPARRGRCGYAIGLDAPASIEEILTTLKVSGYDVGNEQIQDGGRIIRKLEQSLQTIAISLHDYYRWQEALPEAFMLNVTETWGLPQDDSSFRDGAFHLSSIETGKVVIALQPDRGGRIDREESYHDLQRPPRHSYVAFYLWLRHIHKVDALIHLGAHGTLEWLPGKSVMLSEICAPEVVLGPTPLIYPFIVNDPGEAAQAKRRAAAVTIGHLTPPLRQATLFDAAERIENLLDEYTTAVTLDPRRARRIADTIVEEAEQSGLAAECGVSRSMNLSDTLTKLDAWMCDLKEMRIGDGLHVFGRSDPDPVRNACAVSERSALLTALEGRFVQPGPAGAPSRGRSDVLPTGRNIYCIDPRHAPTQTACDIGRQAAREVITRHLQIHGDYPRQIMLDLWGSATIRTGGEDFAQALALLGVTPVWDTASARVIGFEILPEARCEFPRVDVTLHVSGLFRDMFPGLIALFDDAVHAVAARDEDAGFNPLSQAQDLRRVFGAASGSYGLGVGDRIVRGDWMSQEELARQFIMNAGHSVDREGDSSPAIDAFENRIATADAHVHVRDMAEVDVLTGPAFTDFEGGFAAANRALGGKAILLHLDASQPESLRARPLAEEIARTLRMRLANPQWLRGQMRHGHRGAAEIAEGVDNLYALAATSGFVSDAQFDLAFAATIGDEDVRDFMRRVNPHALAAVTHAFSEAQRRDLWRTRRNSVGAILAQLGDNNVAQV